MGCADHTCCIFMHHYLQIFFFFVRRRICDMVDARRSAEPSPQAVVSAHEAVAAKRWYVLSVRCDHA
jgi:hypothetical protein